MHTVLMSRLLASFHPVNSIAQCKLERHNVSLRDIELTSSQSELEHTISHIRTYVRMCIVLLL